MSIRQHAFQNLFIIKPTKCTNFPYLLGHETLHVSCSSSAHHQEFIHCTLGTGIYHTGLKTAFEEDQDGTEFHPGPPRKLSYRVSCRSKFRKLVHLVGFIIKKFVTMHGHMNVKNTFQNSELDKTEIPASCFSRFTP
jgi:hypothetical protein